MLAPPKIRKLEIPPVLPWAVALVLVLAGASGMVILFFFNPATHHIYPVCLFHQWTGWNCPGCGATRALYALLHGRFLLAWRDNALFLSCLAFALGRGSWLLLRKLRHQPAVPWLYPWMLWTWLFLTLGFGVIRNLPGFEWLSPE